MQTSDTDEYEHQSNEEEGEVLNCSNFIIK